MEMYSLLERLSVAAMADAYYIYDNQCTSNPILQIRSKKISKSIYETINRLNEWNPNNEARDFDDYIKVLEINPRHLEVLHTLKKNGYLEAEDLKLKEISDANKKDKKVQAKDCIEAFKKSYENQEKKHFFRTNSFFNLPKDIDPQLVDVALVGVPFASNSCSNGTDLGPSALRRISQNLDWFSIYESGYYSDFFCDNSYPPVFCKNVIPKDLGDIEPFDETVQNLYEAVDDFYETHLLHTKIRPFFVGGDHAITTPLVRSYIKHYPDLCLIHLDAHNDLFFTSTPSYNHASMTSNLLFLDDLQKVFSFGLRTLSDTRLDMHNLIANDPDFKERLHLYGIAATKKMISSPELICSAFAEIPKNTPCYLTIDLDVLSPAAIGGRLSTPHGHGLEWHELFTLLRGIFSSVDVLAVDMVEYNILNGESAGEVNNVNELILFLIHHIAMQKVSQGNLVRSH
jgi:agmatinase